MKKKIFIILLMLFSLLFLFFYIEKNKEVVVNKKFAQPIGEEKVFDLEKLASENKIEEASSTIETLETVNIGNEKKEDTEVAEEDEIEIKKEKTGITILSDVPFLAQAPFGAWSDPRQQDGCEEASSLIAMSWVEGKKEVSKDDALKGILAISEFELEKYGSYNDTSASSTIERILAGYFDYDQARLKYDIEADDIIAELEKGNLVMAPFDGRILKNKFYTAPGPERHMLVIIGYDYDKKEFITNDPGTRQGKGYRYSKETLISAIRDYPTGNHLPIEGARKVMIVVTR